MVGCSGAGKTTFAAALADRLGIGHLELDEAFWAEGWTKRDPDEGRARIRAFLAGAGADGWVVDGNWDSARRGLLDDSLDVLVWLDYPRRLVMRRVVTRTLRRAVTRQELWHGNRERPGNLLSRDPEQNIVLWAWRTHGAYREQYAALAAVDPRVVRLRTPREAERWLRSVG